MQGFGEGLGFFDEGLGDGVGAPGPECSENDFGESFQEQRADAFGPAAGGGGETEPDAETFGDVAADEVEAAEFVGGKPIDLSLLQLDLEKAADGFDAGKGDEGLLNAVLREDLIDGGESGFLGDEEDHGQAEEFAVLDALGGLAHEGGEADVDLLVKELVLDLANAGGREGELEARHAGADLLEKEREVVALDNLGRGDAEAVFGTSPDLGAHVAEAAEEGRDEVVKVLALLTELEGSALEERDAEGVFELEDLRTDGGLLDAVGHVPGGGADTAMLGHVEEEFEVVDVHGGG